MNNVLTAEFDDFDVISDIGQKSLPIYYNKSDLIMLKLTNHNILKIEDNNNIIGFLVYDTILKDKRYHIMSIGVLEEYRRNNKGTELINFLKNKNDYNISLYVQISNDKAINFYKKNDFVIKSTLTDYYQNLEVKDAYHMLYQSN